MSRSHLLRVFVVFFGLWFTACASPAPAPTLPAAVAPTLPAAVAPTLPPTVVPDLKVLAVESFLADIAQNIAGDRVKVETLMPTGVDPHGFEPTPQDMKNVADSNVLIVNGAGFEEFLDDLLKNAGGQRLLIEAAKGIEPRPMPESAHAEEQDHSPETHAKEVCAQLEGKTAKEQIQSGADASTAAEIHGADGHAHGREIITVKLNAQPDGAYAGFLRFDSEAEQGYAFTFAGQIAVRDAAGNPVDAEQAFDLNCAGMTRGSVYKLAVGEYSVALTGSAGTTPFSAAPMHPEGDQGHDHEGHEHEGGDPHFWLDPTKVVMYAENIRDGLTQADPAGAATYKANADAYIAKLKALDEKIQAQVQTIPAANRKIVTDHDTFGYFADRYGFEVVGMLIPSFTTADSTSAQQLAELIDRIRAVNAKAIFLEQSMNPQLAGQVAKDTGVQVVTGLYTHSLSDANGPAPTYLQMLEYDTQLITGALK